MTNKEWIELFFSESYEKQINELVLDDREYEIPYKPLFNYLEHLLSIPYIEFLDYVKELGPIPYNKGDIPQFVKFEHCESSIIRFLLDEDNSGCRPVEIGGYLNYNYLRSNARIDVRYANSNLISAKILGLVYEYYGYWYLNCIGYIYNELSKAQQKSLLARTILRSPFYRTVFAKTTSHINLEDYIIRFPNSFIRYCHLAITSLFDISINEAKRCGRRLFLNSKVSEGFLIGRYYDFRDIKKKSHSRSSVIYLKEAKEWYSLSDRDAFQLLVRYKMGNKDALERIVKTAQPMIMDIASQFSYAPIEDIIQDGNVGLLCGITQYDINRKISFYGFMSFWVKRFIQASEVTSLSLVRIPANVFNDYVHVKKVSEKYFQKNEYMPSVSDIEIIDDIDFERLSFIYNLPDNLKDTTIFYDDLDVFESNTNRINDIVNAEYNKSYVNRLLRCLEGRSEMILRLYYGIGVGAETLDHIGEMFNLTRERTRQIREKAISQLQKVTEDNENHDETVEMTKSMCFVKSINEAFIGNYIEIPELKQLGRIIYILNSKGESVYYVLGIEDRIVYKIAESGSLISDEKKQNYVNKNTERMTPTGMTSEREDFLRNLYHGEIKKKSPSIIRHPSDTVQNKANIGDRIMYDKRCGTVIGKRTSAGTPRLIIKYDNGLCDNVLNDPNKYNII